jgi:hypothetical protein
MTTYRVKFFKNLLSSDGHPFKVLQRVVTVDQSKTADDAVRMAQQQFESCERVSDWRLHADCIEAATEEVSRGHDG